jgi:bacterioferritin
VYRATPPRAAGWLGRMFCAPEISSRARRSGGRGEPRRNESTARRNNPARARISSNECRVSGTKAERRPQPHLSAPDARQERIFRMATSEGAFLTDVKTLRDRTRQSLDKGAVTPSYQGDVAKSIEILQAVLATELVCVLRYTYHAVTAAGISSEGVKDEFRTHADEERDHMMQVAERINQLGGKPNFNPEGLLSRSVSQYAEGKDLVDMIKENLIAERIAVDHYRELVRYFGDRDPATRVMIEGILSVEEEHANDMHDLLVAHEGKPML